MAITNQSKPTTSISNTSAPGNGLIWANDSNSWAAETRTWDETGAIMNNTSRPTTSITNQSRPA